jgi:hypothetical protein
MKNSLFFVLLFALWHSVVVAQKHDYNWVAGYANPQPASSQTGGITIDFNIIPPIANKHGRILNFKSFGVACSDSSGNLLFYSNGIAIHNYLDELMENGDTINPGQFWQGSTFGGYAGFGGFVLPFPGHPNQYYWFYNGFDFEDSLFDSRFNPFYYALIDMNANDGKGKVLLKNQVLLNGDPGWPAACKHGNGRDWWITCYESNIASQVTYLLSPDGLSPAVEQPIGPVFIDNENISKSVFSPDGRIYIRHDGSNGPRIMDFDRCTGQFSNLRWLPYPDEIFSWSASFSPDSRFLYLTKPTVVWWLDLKAANISASFDTLALYNGGYCPTPSWRTTIWMTQEAPDGKTYAINNPASTCMGILEQPGLPGLAADMNYGGFELPRWNSSTTCHFPHYRLGISVGSPCDTLAAATGPGSELFYQTNYVPSSVKAASKGSEIDYVILPTVHATPSAEARAEKRQMGDLGKVLYERMLRRGEQNMKEDKK